MRGGDAGMWEDRGKPRPLRMLMASQLGLVGGGDDGEPGGEQPSLPRLPLGGLRFRFVGWPVSKGGGIIVFCGPPDPVSLWRRFTSSGLDSATLPRVALPSRCAAPSAAARGGEGENGNLLPLVVVAAAAAALFCFIECVMLAKGNGGRVLVLGRTSRDEPLDRNGSGSRGGGATTLGERKALPLPLVEVAAAAAKAGLLAWMEGGSAGMAVEEPARLDAAAARAGDDGTPDTCGDAGEPCSPSSAAFWMMISFGGSP